MRKLMTLFLVVMALLILSGCTSEPKKDEFTIKVFDVVGKEILDGTKLKCDYTGKKINYDIIAYCNEEEIFKATLEDVIEAKEEKPLLLSLIYYKESSSQNERIRIRKLPLEVGNYNITLKFNLSKEYNDKMISKQKYHNFGFSIEIVN